MTAVVLSCLNSQAILAQEKLARYLYVSSRDGAGGKGGKGIYVYDIDKGHKLVKFIAMPELGGTRGMCGCAKTGKLWIAHANDKLLCMDIKTEKVVWEKQFAKEEGGCDRIGVTPDGGKLYVPSGWWSAGKNVKVIEGDTGKLLKNIEVSPKGGLHNLIVTNDGKKVVVGSTNFDMLSVIDTEKDEVTLKVGPIIGVIQPLTINGDASLAYINTHLYRKDHGPGFEIGDLKTGKILHVVGRPELKERKSRCHGIGLTPDEKEVWVVDQEHKEIHVFDNTVMPPRFLQTIPMSAKTHGWICFSRDGKYAWSDTGEVIDVATKKVVGQLTDEKGNPVMTSKFFELHMLGGEVAWIGQQMGVGYKGAK
jgi:DNA-binding beta-propeller fold protein YncE